MVMLIRAPSMALGEYKFGHGDCNEKALKWVFNQGLGRRKNKKGD